jgi:predicted esterase
LLWLTLLGWLLCGPARAAGTEFVAAPDFAAAGPTEAKGALVWIHGTYARDQPGPPPPPDFVSREAKAGFDVWYLRRDRDDDPISRGADMLARGVWLLRERGYRHVIVAGHSRGAWIALTILAHPGLADAVAAFSPAAHGTSDERKPRAIADWTALWALAVNNGTHVVLVQLASDAWDPDPWRRLAIAQDKFGANLLSIFQPSEPVGHSGVYEPAFDERFGALVQTFVAPPEP